MEQTITLEPQFLTKANNLRARILKCQERFCKLGIKKNYKPKFEKLYPEFSSTLHHEDLYRVMSLRKFDLEITKRIEAMCDVLEAELK